MATNEVSTEKLVTDLKRVVRDSEELLQASAGAALHLPILAGMSLAILLTQFKIASIRTLASSVRDLRGSSPSDVGARPAVPLLDDSDAAVGAQHAAPLFGKAPSAGDEAAPPEGDTLKRAPTSPLLAPWEVDWCQPIALLVGNEGAGLPEEIERSADARIHIPMASGVESLNAAAAAAVVFYEAARQRNSNKPL